MLVCGYMVGSIKISDPKLKVERGIAEVPCRAVLMEQLCSKVSLCFFQEKQEKYEKTGKVSKVWKVNKGQNIWKASRSSIWKKKKWKLC